MDLALASQQFAKPFLDHTAEMAPLVITHRLKHAKSEGYLNPKYRIRIVK